MSQQRQVSVYTPQTLATFSPEVLQVMRQSYAPTATDAEFMMFAHRCAITGLDPFKHQIFFTKYKSEKYGEQVRIMYAEDAYLDKAREMEGFQPPDTQVVREGDKFKARYNPETKGMEIAEFEIGEENRGKIIRAFSIAYRDGYRPVTVIVEMSDLEHMFKGPNRDNWEKWTPDMIGKFAEQRALKKQYGLHFGSEEIGPQPETPAYEPPARRDVTNEVNAASTQTAPQESAKPEQPEVPQPDSEEKKLRAELTAKFKRLGITDREKMTEYIESKGVVKGETPTLQELKKLLKLMDIDIAAKYADDDLPL